MPRSLPHFLPDHEPALLLAATTRPQDRVLLLVALNCGLRVAELCDLAVEDLDLGRRILWVRQGKGSKDRAVPIPRKILEELRGWIGERRAGPCFLSRQGGGAIKPRAVQLMVKRLAVAAGLPGATARRRVHPHLFRHHYASRLLETGATIYEVKELLGHACLATTERYLRALPERLTAAVDRL